MRNYEGIYVLNLQGSEEGVDDLVSVITTELEAEGAKLKQVDRVGRKEFAYENHAKQKHGYYVQCQFEAEPDAIEKVRGKLSLNDDIQLQHYQVR
ncbi:MAG: 30S ribosomal protein S6 [Verrucomicrobiae bacterium]|nr:30S ribosomal protein S6 [Verrucomicrobiae bacterium]